MNSRRMSGPPFSLPLSMNSTSLIPLLQVPFFLPLFPLFLAHPFLFPSSPPPSLSIFHSPHPLLLLLSLSSIPLSLHFLSLDELKLKYSTYPFPPFLFLLSPSPLFQFSPLP